MKFIRGILLILFVFNLSIACFGNDKPTLKVEFKIIKKEYQVDFPSSLQYIEKKSTRYIVTALNESLKFLNFTEDPNPIILKITLENEDPDSDSPMQAAVFKITLSNSQLKGKIKEVHWQFRQGDEFRKPLPEKADGFILMILSRFKAQLGDKKEVLVDHILSKIPIAEKAFHYPNSKLLIMPFTDSDLGIGLSSIFLVRTEIERTLSIMAVVDYTTEGYGYITKDDPLLPDYLRHTLSANRGKVIITQAIKPENKLYLMTSGSRIIPRKVFIKKYENIEEEAIKTTENLEVGRR